jgi:hypothetical protein
VTENTEYLFLASRFSVPLPKGRVADPKDYEKEYSGMITALKVAPDSGEMSVAFQILMPPFDYDLASTGKGPTSGYVFFTSSMWTVSKFEVSNGLGAATNKTCYRYKNAMLNNEGRGFQGFKTIVAEDNYFNGTEIGYRFKTGTNRGGGAGGTTSMADGVTLRDTVFNNILSTGIEMTGAYPDSTGFPSGGIGFFRWITISNITGTVGSNAYAINISGNPSPHHTNLSLTNVHLTGGSSSKGISVYQASNSTFNSVTASTGSFFIEPGSWGNTFTSCVPTPTPR